MLQDALAAFWPIGSVIAITNAAVRSNVIDLIGAGAGTPPRNVIGTPAVYGNNPGIGFRKPLIEVGVGVTFVGGTSINVAFQGAVDTGATGGYQPGTWSTYIETGAVLTANLLQDTVFAKMDFPDVYPEGTRPRFLSLLATPVGTFTSGSLRFGIVTMGRDDLTNKFAGKNFIVA